MKVDWPEAEEALRASGRTVHIGVPRGWSSSMSEREIIDVGGVRARVARKLYGCTYDDFPEAWRTMNTWHIIDPVTASNYGLYGVLLVRVNE